MAPRRAQLGWDWPAFEVPSDIREAWQAAGRRSADAAADWDRRLAASPQRAEFQRRMKGELPADTGVKARIDALRSAESRVGKECVSKCRYRWVHYNYNKQKIN